MPRDPNATTTRDPSAWDDPRDRVDRLQLSNGRTAQRCRASLSSRTRRCRKAASHGKLVCKSHGGASTGPPLKHGLYMQALGPLREAFATFVADPELRDLDRGIAALDSWTAYQIELAGKGDGKDFRAEAVELYHALDDAIGGGDMDAMRRALLNLGRHLEAGGKEYDQLERAMVTVEKRQTAAAKAQEIELRADQVINAAGLLAVLQQVIAIVVREAPKDAGRIIEAVTVEVMEGRLRNGADTGPPRQLAS